jgi:hypothetical protein
MLRRFLALAATAALFAVPATALAAPTTITERVEGATTTLHDGSVTTDAKVLNGHACDGSSSKPPQAPGATALSGLDDAGVSWTGTWSDDPTFGGDFFVGSIGGESPAASNLFWGLFINGAASSAGGCQTLVHAGDEVLWAITDGSQPTLRLTGPTKAATGEAAPVRVEQVAWNGTLTPASGAQVGGQTTDAAGNATVTFNSAGNQPLKATQTGAIRSNSIAVCVYAPGSGACDTVPAGTQGQHAGKDSIAPTAVISSPGNGKRYARGPRVLKGRASDNVGLYQVYFRLRRYAAGGCSWYSSKSERFTRPGHCASARFQKLGTDSAWSYLLPARLPKGRYVLEQKAIDTSYNATRARSTFRVTR